MLVLKVLYLMCILLCYLHNCSRQYCMLPKSFASREAGVHMGLLLFVYTAKIFSKLFFDWVSLISSVINLLKYYGEGHLSSLTWYIYIIERFKKIFLLSLKFFFLKAGSSLTSFGTEASSSSALSQSSAVGSAFTQDTRALKTQLSQGKLVFPSKISILSFCGGFCLSLNGRAFAACKSCI